MARRKPRKVPSVVRTAQQHGDTCSLVCLEILSGDSFDTVLAHAKRTTRHWQTGLWGTEIQRLGASLGLTLRERKTWDWEADTGILDVMVKQPGRRGKWDGHAVVLFHGLIYDAYMGQLSTPEAYQDRKDVRIRCLHRMEDA